MNTPSVSNYVILANAHELRNSIKVSHT